MYAIRSYYVLALDTLEQKVRESIPNAAPLAVSDILRWPGIVREPQKDFDALEEPVLECLAEAVGMLQSARRVEGERIAEFIAQRSQSIDAVISAAKPLLRASETRYREKLIERIERLGVITSYSIHYTKLYELYAELTATTGEAVV